MSCYLLDAAAALILLIAATLVFGHYGAGYDATAFLYAQF